MSLLSLVFWGLVLVTALISFRWGAMIGLVVFVCALMAGAVAVSRWPPPPPQGAGQIVPPVESGEARISGKISMISYR